MKNWKLLFQQIISFMEKFSVIRGIACENFFLKTVDAK